MSTYTGTRLFFLNIGGDKYNKTPDGSVLTCKPDGSDLHTLVSHIGTHPDGIAIDIAKKHIYYTNMGADPAQNDGFISRIDSDGSNNIDVIPKGVTFTPKQITIEHASGKMYWCDREGMRVWRADMDGSNAEILYRAGEGEEARKDESNHCVGIAVDLGRKQILWTQKGPPKGGQGRLFTAGIDMPKGEMPDKRSDVKTLMEELPEPIDLEYDAEAQVLYKTDRGAEPRGNTVSRVHLDKDGKAIEEILVSHLHEAIGMALDLKGKKMYFTDLGGSVYAADLDGSKKKEILTNMGDLTGICVAHFE